MRRNCMCRGGRERGGGHDMYFISIVTFYGKEMACLRENGIVDDKSKRESVQKKRVL